MTEHERSELIQRLRQWSRHGQAHFMHDDLKAAADELARLEKDLRETILRTQS